jgi:acetyltransferase-like isoleucine patch superfamily enzyme
MHISNIQLGKNVQIEIDSNVNNIKIGDNTRIANRVKIFGSETDILEIGKNSYVGLNSFIEGFNSKVVIGDHTWIGGNSIIMPAVTLGKYCVVAANSFVNKSFPDYTIIGGTPAKLIRTLTPSEIETLHSND